ncbi:hypothetical protein CAG54_00530 [Vibrio sp. V27_P1S3P104]|uniref:LPP20 family lipoprotein n=1 Tax=unclassified Vibrio TaxID=2614977 RepID=UPI001373585B|nr:MULTISPECIES: LPP20 family lipoprotein [unclassified Vibrio]NAX34090.1 hypothetical protein [Vibrio sp. V29_P1S30P107]NAX36011.1 hypothetical protein [Vibrio sp. V27_P1S3P104]
MNKMLLPVVMGAILLAGCTSAPKQDNYESQLKSHNEKLEREQEKAVQMVELLPAWVMSPLKNSNLGVYGVGIGESKNLGNALKKAELNAQFELAKALGQEINGNQQSYTKDTGNNADEQFTQLIDSIVDSVPLQGYESIEKEVKVVDGKYIAYNLMYLSFEKFEKSLEKEKEKSVSDEAKEAFSELEKRLNERKLAKESK